MDLRAVMSSFFGGLPRNGSKGSLEEGVVDYVSLIVFALNDPITGKNFAFSGFGEDGSGASALLGFYEERSASPKGLQCVTPDGVVLPTRSISALWI
jgi:hypothetical protein